MTPEQLEAHRVRFEQRFYAEFGLEPLRSGPGYVEAAASDAWQAYQWALDDVDRAQRAAPGVQGGEAHYLKLPDHPTSAWNAAEMQVLTAWGQLLQAAAPQQSAQPGGEAVKLVDALLLEAEIFWWNDGPEGKSSDAMKAARDQVIVALSAAAQPVEVQPLTEFAVMGMCEYQGIEQAQGECLIRATEALRKSDSGNP